MELRGRWVLLTGASSGLGRAMSRVLARDHGANLILTARRRDRLGTLADTLTSDHGVEAVCLPADLTRIEDVDRLFQETVAGRTVYAAVLNAGVTHYGPHLDMPWDSFQTLLATNVTSLVQLTGKLVPYLSDRNEGGGLMWVSSMAGFLPMPYQAAYGGTKAFVSSFTRSLRVEVRDRNVSLTVFAPGGIATEMLEASGLDRRFKADGPGIMPVDRCAELGVKAMVRRKDLAVPGFSNRLSLLVMRLLPRRMADWLMGKIYRVGWN